MKLVIKFYMPFYYLFEATPKKLNWFEKFILNKSPYEYKEIHQALDFKDILKYIAKNYPEFNDIETNHTYFL